MTPRVLIYARQEAESAGISVEAVLSRSAYPGASSARQAVMRRLRADGFTYNQIGRWMGRHRSTVIHACRRAG